MFDIGIGEIIVLAILGLVVFGPERLPKAAADAGRLVCEGCAA
ncbi:MAG: twin-arginine translocase TatA/TatE family subunit [Actinobacteria bacterium]|nr:twin-arginine translocase TatA/TatE family subunit [Actinomycetota bacterium]